VNREADADPKNKATNWEIDRVHSLFTGSLGSSSGGEKPRERVRKEGVGLGISLDNICGVELARELICRNGLECKIHSVPTKKRVDRGVVTFDECLRRWKEDGKGEE
jgi:hypothetical protein